MNEGERIISVFKTDVHAKYYELIKVAILL